MENKTKRITTVGMLCAVAYIVTLIGRFPVVLFLKYDPKDIIIAIGGFIFGPMISLIVSVVVSFVEMFTASDTGLYGLIMNIISSCSFACVAAFIYKRQRNLTGAIAGLIVGVICMSGMMLLWNYIITPFYMGVPREAIADMLISAFLPFNLIKGGLNAAITMILYKPIVVALRKLNLVENTDKGKSSKLNIGVVIVAVPVVVTCVLFVLALNGKL